MIPPEGILFDPHKFVEVFRFDRNTRAGIYETGYPPILYRGFKDMLRPLTLLLPEAEIMEPQGKIDECVRILTFDDLAKKKVKVKLDAWIVLDLEGTGVAGYLLSQLRRVLRPGGRLILVRKKVIVPLLQTGAVVGGFIDAGFRHLGTVDMSPYVECDVFLKDEKRGRKK